MTATPRAPRLVGREHEVSALDEALARPGTVLVTGPPGVGKTALVAATVRGRDDLLWVSLSGARSAADLWAALGRGLDANLVKPDEAVEQVARRLASRGVALVVLDAAELLPQDAWEAVASVQAAAPSVRWVVASVVTPPVADAARLHLGPLGEAEAVELLLRLATARALESPPDPSDPTWSALARRLDGLPLALELAAARLGLLEPEQLLARLDDAHALSGGRYSTAEGALRYAWSLLGPDEQTDLATLSALRGGFSLEAAEAVLGPAALDRLDALRERSALIVRRGRFHLLDGLRRIAREELPDVVERSADALVPWWGARAEALRRHTVGTENLRAGQLLDEERSNLWAAWERARTTDVGAAASIGAALVNSLVVSGPVWAVRDLQGLDDIGRAVGGAPGSTVLVRLAEAHLALFQHAEGRALLDEALAMAEQAGAERQRALALQALGLSHMHLGELDEARRVLVEACALQTDPDVVAQAYNRLGALELLADRSEAAAEALEAARKVIDAAQVYGLAGSVHINLAIIRADQGRRAEAEDLIARAVEETATQTESGHGFALFHQALISLGWGDVDRAEASAERAVAVLDAHGSDVFRSYGRVVLAMVRWARDDLTGARELLVEAGRLCEPRDYRGAVMARVWLAALDASTSGDRSELRDELERAVEAGMSRNLADALSHLGGIPTPEPEELTVYARIARWLARSRAPALRVDSAGRWFENGGERVDLSRRGSMHRILAALAEARTARPGEGLSVEQVFAAGWPGQRAVPEAASGRVYTAVRELRALGLGGLLLRHAEGYLLDPAVPIEVV